MPPSDAAPDKLVRLFQSETAEIIEAPEPTGIRATTYMAAALVVALVVLAAITRLDRVIESVGGEIVTTEPTEVLQSLDPALIKTINVRVGDRVKAGDVLATLDPTFASADADALRLQVANYDAQIARAEAERDGRALPEENVAQTGEGAGQAAAPSGATAGATTPAAADAAPSTPISSAGNEPAGAQTATAGAKLTVKVSLDPKLTAQVAPDDTLFVTIGDDSLNNGDPDTLRAQDLNEPYGKMLRLTADGTGVASNPFFRPAAPASWRSRIYAYGYRNPFRFDLDPRSGIPILGDVGWNTVEEIDTVLPGMNGGWPCYEGRMKTYFAPQPVCQKLYAAGTVRMPIATYRHNHVQAAVVGGTVYTGSSYPAAYAGAFFYGDYGRGQVWTLTTDPAGNLTRAPEPDGFATGVPGPVAFDPGPNGDITFADLAGGTVQRLVYTSGNRAPVAAFSFMSDPDTRTVQFDASASYDLDGDQLGYSWDFGDGSPAATGASAMHVYPDGTPREVTLTVTDQLGATNGETLPVHPTNHTPQLALELPDPPLTYAVDGEVQLSASASDPEDGPLTVHWLSSLLHCPFAGSCHVHPDAETTGPTFSEPFTDHGADTVMLIKVFATDADGATAVQSYEAKPKLHTLAVDSPVAVSINGEVAASAQVVVNSEVELSAPLRSSYWRFVSWSDGFAATHSIVMADADLALVAAYRTAIAAKHAALAHPVLLLGRPTGPEHDLAAGRVRTYTLGNIYWSGPTGAHEVHGPILARFRARGGVHSCLGFPTSDVLTTTFGFRTTFAGGVITYSRADGRITVTC